LLRAKNGNNNPYDDSSDTFDRCFYVFKFIGDTYEPIT
jgi:hypothetical protein